MALCFAGTSESPDCPINCIIAYADDAYEAIWVRHAKHPTFPLMFYHGRSLTWSFFQMVPNPCIYPKSSRYDFLISSMTDIFLWCTPHIVYILLLQHFIVFANSISESSFFSTIFQLSHPRQQLNSEPSQLLISLICGNWYTPFLPRNNSFMQMFSADVCGIIPN